MSLRHTDLDTFMDELDRLPEPLSRKSIIDLLASFSGRSLYLSKIRLFTRRRKHERVRAAAVGLASGGDRADVTEAISRRFGVSRRTAQRDMDSALSMPRANRG